MNAHLEKMRQTNTTQGLSMNDEDRAALDAYWEGPGRHFVLPITDIIEDRRLRLAEARKEKFRAFKSIVGVIVFIGSVIGMCALYATHSEEFNGTWTTYCDRYERKGVVIPRPSSRIETCVE